LLQVVHDFFAGRATMACTVVQQFFAGAMPTYHPEFARLLGQYLNRQDRSAAWLARQLHVSSSTVSRWLEGSTRPEHDKN
jgi:hypothetical protein